MRILFGITKSNWGGAQRYVFDLATAAKDVDHNVTVLCGGEGPLVIKLEEAGIRVIPLPNLGRDISIFADIKSFFKILAILKRERPDIFHINSSKMGGVGALAGKLVGIKKIIFTAHGWAFNEERSWVEKMIIKKLIWWTIALSHKTICVSEKTKQDIWYFPFIQNKLVVIHNGIELFPMTPRTENGILTIGTISELHYTKGLDVVLKAFALTQKDRNSRFVIIGEGERKSDLVNMIKPFNSGLNIENQVLFKGFLQNAREYLSNIDIFVLGSRTEGLPYTLLEAGMASLPVIATNVGGVPEIIKDNQTGILIPKEDVEALAKALEKLANDPGLRQTLGQNLNKFVRENFSKERMIKETLRLYAN